MEKLEIIIIGICAGINIAVIWLGMIISSIIMILLIIGGL